MAKQDGGSRTLATALPAGPRWPGLIQASGGGLRRSASSNIAVGGTGRSSRSASRDIGKLVALADPVDIKAVFTSERELFLAGEANAATAPFLRQLGEHSLLLLDGDEHLRQRRLMLPAFHGEAVRAYAERVEQITGAEVDRWPVGEAFAIRPRLRAITLEVILRAVIGVKDQRRLERLRALLPQLLDFSVLATAAAWMSPRLIDSRIGQRHRTMRAGAEVDRFLYRGDRRAPRGPRGRNDILAMLIHARDEHGETLGDEALRDQIITLLLAGHETTTTALAWCFERLVRHPDVLAACKTNSPQATATHTWARSSTRRCACDP